MVPPLCGGAGEPEPEGRTTASSDRPRRPDHFVRGAEGLFRLPVLNSEGAALLLLYSAEGGTLGPDDPASLSTAFSMKASSVD